MRNRVLFLAVGVLLLPAVPVRAKESACATCHVDESMEEAARKPAILFAGDAHDRAGLTCVSCHGGDPGEKNFVKAHRKAGGFRSRPKEKEIVSLCSGCHDDAARMKEFGVENPDLTQVSGFRASVHGRIDPVEGFEIPTCASCHGSHGIRPPEEPLSAVHPLKVPDVCARCHSDLAYMRAFTSARVRVDQLIEYRTSVHGRLLASGDTRVAVCSSCHGSHDILPGSDPHSRVHPVRVEETCGGCHADREYMKGYTLEGPDGAAVPFPTDQLDAYRRSVHRAALVEKGDLSAPTCNDCHGNHGATPPEVRVVVHVCKQCHSRPAELYEGSDLRADLDHAGMPHCATCHEHHQIVRPGDSMLIDLSNGATSSGWKPSERWRGVARGFHDSIVDMEGRLETAEALVARVEDYGMDLTRARLRLTRARDRLIQSRVIVHSFDPAKMAGIIEGSEDAEGGRSLVAAATKLADSALSERRVRRYGLGAALAIIAFLATMLLLKIRQMESARR